MLGLGAKGEEPRRVTELARALCAAHRHIADLEDQLDLRGGAVAAPTTTTAPYDPSPRSHATTARRPQELARDVMTVMSCDVMQEGGPDAAERMLDVIRDAEASLAESEQRRKEQVTNRFIHHPGTTASLLPVTYPLLPTLQPTPAPPVPPRFH